MYDRDMVKFMIDELTNVGFKELSTPEQVAQAIPAKGTNLLVVNSVCGCAAGKARPGVIHSLKNKNVPTNLYTVFAGLDIDATDKARSLIKGYPPSSPSIAMFKDGELVFMLERHMIEGKDAESISMLLRAAFDKFCGAKEEVAQTV